MQIGGAVFHHIALRAHQADKGFAQCRADQSKHDTAEHRNGSQLGGITVGLFPFVRAQMLGHQRDARDGKPHSHRDEQRVDRPDEGYRSQLIRAHPAQPEAVHQVIQRLDKVVDHNWEGKPQNGAVQISLQKISSCHKISSPKSYSQ